MSISRSQFLQLPIEASGLPENIVLCLKEENIFSMWNLLMLTADDLLNLGVGGKSLVEIRRAALGHGLSLGCSRERMEEYGIYFDAEVC